MLLPKQFNNDDVKIVAEEVVFSGFFRVRKFHLQFRRFQGDWTPVVERECFERGGACAVLLYDPLLDKVILSEQFRVGAVRDEISPWQYEIVAGMLEEDESVEETIRREAVEEAGCEIHDLIPIMHYYTTPGGCSERIKIFCAHVDSTKISGIHGSEEEAENIRLHVVSREAAYQLIGEGKIRNGTAIIALQWLMISKVFNP